MEANGHLKGDLRGTPSDVDPTVIASAAGGDVKAFSEIYARSAPGVRRYVRTIIWNRWDAEDVTQDVFVKLFAGLSQYDPERAAFSGWVLRVARNTAIDHLRRSAARPVQHAADEQAAVDDAGVRCGESLREALEPLTDSQREILMLRALGGYSPPEVAVRVQRTRGAINTLYHRARLAARDNLTAMGAGPSTCPDPAYRRSEPASVVLRAP